MRPISSQEFFECRSRLNELCEEIMRGKNPVYTVGSDNYVANFQESARRLETTDRKVVMTHLDKQYAAILTAILHEEIKDVESIDSRFADARNYLDILYALVKSAQLPTITAYVPIELDVADDIYDHYDPPTCPV